MSFPGAVVGIFVITEITKPVTHVVHFYMSFYQNGFPNFVMTKTKKQETLL